VDPFSERYAQVTFQRDYPLPPPEVEATEKSAAPAKGSRQRAQENAPGVGDAGMALMDMLAGALKGSVAQVLGLPGDVESLYRLIADGQQKLLTTDEFLKRLPAVVPPQDKTLSDLVAPKKSPREHTAHVAEEAGTFLPLAPVGIVRAGVTAAKRVRYAADGTRIPLPPSPAPGGLKAQRGAIGPQTGFEKVPDSLMGYRRSGPQKSFGETKYPVVVFVEVTDEKGEKFYDAIRGMNTKHATERAKRNWDEGMKVNVISAEDALKRDPELVAETDALMTRAAK
jgi:hypothetical protein